MTTTEEKMTATPRPWALDTNEDGDVFGVNAPDAELIVCDPPPAHFVKSRAAWEANAALIVKAVNAHDDLVAALKAAEGYLLNAKIDLETGAPKRTAIQTIEGGLKVVRAALAKAGA